MKLLYLLVIKIKWQLHSHSPGIKYKRHFKHHRTWKRHLKYAGSGTYVKMCTTMLQESIAAIFSSITNSHLKTKQSGIFTDPCNRYPPALVIKTNQWIIWWSFGFVQHMVDVCCNVLQEQAASLFRVIESHSGGCWSGWEETNMSVTWDSQTKSGQRSKRGEGQYWTNRSVFQEQPF